MARAYLGLGANIGNRKRNLQAALDALDELYEVVAVSSLYRSEAVVMEGMPAGPDYLNAACAIDVAVTAEELLAAAKSIEHAMGRRPTERWAPRPIDIDILLFDAEVIETEALAVPHPRILERNFVMAPLAEIAPDAMHPGRGQTIGELAEEVDFAGLEHLEDPGWWRAMPALD